MGWPIPEIPEKFSLPPPRFYYWIALMLIMAFIGTLLALFIGKSDSYYLVFLYGTLPAFLLWVCIFGVVLNRYNQSSAAVYSWDEETNATKEQWQKWSRKQLSVVGNVLLSPESTGIGSMLGNPSEIPMYPNKGRPLTGRAQALSLHLKSIDEALNCQSVNYRCHLYTIYVLRQERLHQKSIEQAIYQQWDLMPEFVHSLEEIPCFNVDTGFDNLALILCINCWPNMIPQAYSEIISAQLVCTPTFMKSHNYTLLAGLGRRMPVSVESLKNDLGMLFEYNKIDSEQLKNVWLSGETEKNAANVAIYANTIKWTLPEKRPVHYIDLTFGPPGQFAFEISLAMMVDAVQKTSQNQLVIYQKSGSIGWLCLVTRELFL